MRKCTWTNGLLYGMIALAGFSTAATVRAAEWQLFGIDGLSGYLAWKSENVQERQYDLRDERYSLEQLARFRAGSYIFHPRFLTLNADSTFALRRGSEADSGLRNLDTELAVDFLPQHFLSFGVSGRGKVEDLERDFKDYQRETSGGSAYVSLRGGLLPATSLKVESNETKSAGYFPEDRLTRYISAESYLRQASTNRVSVTYRAVEVDDRLGNQDTSYQTADLNGEQAVLGDRGKINFGLTAWDAKQPSPEKRLTIRETWLNDWTATLRTSEDAELTTREYGGTPSTTYKASLDATNALSETWLIGGNLGATRNASPNQEESAVYRAAGRLGYQSNWREYTVSADSRVSITHSITGVSRRLPVYGEVHDLSLLGGLEPLVFPNVTGPIKVYQPVPPGADWTEFCEINVIDGVTNLRWKTEMRGDPDYPVIPAGNQFLEVAVDYQYELPSSRFSELGGNLGARASRELKPGLGIEGNVSVNSSVPINDETESHFAETRYEVGTRGYFKRDGNEASVGATVGRDRRTLYARGAAAFHGWTLTESFRSEFYPEIAGVYLESKASRLWGIGEKTHLSVVLSDQTQTTDGRLSQGLTAVKVGGTRLFNPFMRLELEGRAEINRAVADDTRMALDTKYIWQQGLLDLTVGYEFTRRTYDRFTGSRLYGTLIRKF